MATIDVRLPKGFRDLPPEEMVLRENLLEKIRTIFWKYGFQPLETPTIEYLDILKGKMGEEAENLLYHFVDRGDRELGLVYDLTVPLSRYIAMTHDVVFPFKRYQIQRVWRAEKPQRGRYREFYQCDIDTAGEKKMIADAEIIACANEVFQNIGFYDYTININNRKLLTGIVEYAGLPADEMVNVCRCIDKMDKIGRDGVIKELKKYDYGDEIIDAIFEILDCTGTIDEKIEQVSQQLNDIPIARESLAELKELFAYLDELGVSEDKYEFNLYLSRGLDYYTGPIFETVLNQIPDFGSIGGGGRYDNLIGLFAGRTIPAVGTSFGFGRILAAMKELDMITTRDSRTEVLVIPFNKSVMSKCLEITRKLRKSDIRTEIYYKPGKLRRQLGYASDKEIPLAIILGPDEMERNEVSLKNMLTREQKNVSFANLVNAIWDELERF